MLFWLLPDPTAPSQKREFAHRASGKPSVLFYFIDWLTTIMIPVAVLLGLVIPLKWALTIGLSMPALAFLQGFIFFINRRVSYGHFPIPMCPCHGVTVCVDKTRMEKDSDDDTFLANAQNQKPLKLLVIGDSLAIGIGQDKTTTPILPQIIAQTVSRRNNGRPVYWSVYGKTGKSSGWFWRDLQSKQKQAAHAAQPSPKDQLSSHSDSGSDTASTSSSEPDTFVDGEDIVWHERLQQHSARFNQTFQMDDYDIVVCITGPNDVKDVLFPFINEDNVFDWEKVKSKVFSMSSEINREITNLVQFVRSASKNKQPLIVLPGVPIRSSVIALNFPANHLGVPTFCLMNYAKKELGQKHDDVLYVEPSSIDAAKEFLLGQSFVNKAMEAERQVLNIVERDEKICDDVTRQMKDFFSPAMPRNYQLTLLEKWCSFVFGYPTFHMKMAAADGIHSNERGADAWARYIGELLCDEFEQRSSSS